MSWLGVVCGLIAVFLLGLLLIETARFKKELKKAINDDRRFSNTFIQRLNRKSSKEIILGIMAFIFIIFAVVLS